MYRDHGIRSEGLIVDGDSKLPIVELFESDVYANASNLPADYIKLNEAVLKGQKRDRFLLGKWVAYEGLVYGEFSQERNIITRTQALEHLNDCLRRHVRLRVIE